jgi:nitroreductase
VTDLAEAMCTMPATRSYTDEPVGDDVLYRVLDNARFAPSGGNRQPWRVIVVRDPAQKWRLREQYVLGYQQMPVYAERGPDPFAEHLEDVPVLLVVCVEVEALSITDTGLGRPSIVGGASIYPFVQNLLLALRNEGLGCLISTLVCPREPELKRILDIPDGIAVACVVAAGRPQRALRKPSRRPVETFASFDRFGGPPLAEPA